MDGIVNEKCDMPKQHDKYGKQVLRKAVAQLNCKYLSPAPRAKFGENAGSFQVDGVILQGEGADLADGIAIEIESRTNKQVRGAILDLYLHPCRSKLIVLIPRYNSKEAEAQCRAIMKRLDSAIPFEVVVLSGDGNNQNPMNHDVTRVVVAVQKLLVPPPTAT
jgi:hypothetical protein